MKYFKKLVGEHIYLSPKHVDDAEKFTEWLNDFETTDYLGRNERVITVAGEKKEYKDGLTLPELIELEKVETPEYVTVSLNDEFVEGDNKATTVLKDGDNVEFLYFMGGGR